MTEQKTEGLTKLRALLKGARICMLTTRDEDGNLRSRPMAMQEKEIDADLWFFTARHSPKMGEVQEDDRVNVSVVNGNAYVSISGRATQIEDRQKAEELWNPAYKLWFPKGLEDPELVLLKVTMEHAEFWDNPGGMVTTLLAYVKTLTTGERPKVGENGVVNR
jgi:general stress protein 26